MRVFGNLETNAYFRDLVINVTPVGFVLFDHDVVSAKLFS